MRRILRFAPAEVLPVEQELRHRAGLPEDRDPPDRIRRDLDKALAMLADLAAPIGLFDEVGLDEFEDVHGGEGASEPESPLSTIAPRAERLALFAATVGEPVSARVRELFDAGESPLGFLLDAVASEAAARLADLVAGMYLSVLVGGACGEGATRVLAYSPGYCGWHVRGQHALFRRLAPGEIGITLNPSGLMAPVKSVSGVLLAGPPEVHRFRPRFTFCDACTTHDCYERMASVRRRSPGTAGHETGPWTS